MEGFRISTKVNVNLENCTKELVRVMACNKVYKLRPYMPTLIFDTKLQMYRNGVEQLTDKQLSVLKDKYSLDINKGNNLVLQNMKQLVLYKDETGAYILDKDFAMYNLLLIQPDVAASANEVIPGTSVMYLDNFEKEASSQVSVEKLKYRAMEQIMKCTPQDMIDLLFFFNQNPMNMSQNIIEKNAISLKDTRPAEVIKFFEKKEVSDRVVFVNKLLAAKLLTKDVHGVIMYDKEALGVGSEAASAYLYNEANDRIFSALKQSLEATKGI